MEGSPPRLWALCFGVGVLGWLEQSPGEHGGLCSPHHSTGTGNTGNAVAAWSCRAAGHPTPGVSLLCQLSCLHSLSLQRQRLKIFPIICVCCSPQKSHDLFLQ